MAYFTYHYLTYGNRKGISAKELLDYYKKILSEEQQFLSNHMAARGCDEEDASYWLGHYENAKSARIDLEHRLSRVTAGRKC